MTYTVIGQCFVNRSTNKYVIYLIFENNHMQNYILIHSGLEKIYYPLNHFRPTTAICLFYLRLHFGWFLCMPNTPIGCPHSEWTRADIDWETWFFRFEKSFAWYHPVNGNYGLPPSSLSNMAFHLHHSFSVLIR